MAVPVEVVAFLDARAPDRRGVLDDWRPVLGGTVHAAAESVEQNQSLGLLFERLVGLDLAEVPPDYGLFGFLAAADRQALLEGLGYRQTEPSGDQWRRFATCQPPLDEGQRAAVEQCARLQIFIELHRNHPIGTLNVQGSERCGGRKV